VWEREKARTRVIERVEKWQGLKEEKREIEIERTRKIIKECIIIQINLMFNLIAIARQKLKHKKLNIDFSIDLILYYPNISHDINYFWNHFIIVVKSSGTSKEENQSDVRKKKSERHTANIPVRLPSYRFSDKKNEHENRTLKDSYINIIYYTYIIILLYCSINYYIILHFFEHVT
jgi:hypothetical protein